MTDNNFDVIIIGGGAAGLHCAATAGKRGRRVLVIERSEKLGNKILISGGGRCNFTNLGAAPNNYISENPHFCISALSRYKPRDFIRLIDRYGIGYHEKKLGQLFCDGSAKQIVDTLARECRDSNVKILLNCKLVNVELTRGIFVCSDLTNNYTSDSLIIATGGMAIPAMGATDFAFRIAKKFGINVIAPRPALAPLILGKEYSEFAILAGVSAETIVSNIRTSFRESILFTHRGLSGPAILQISSYWREGETITINLLPDIGMDTFLKENRTGNLEVYNALADILPKRAASLFCEREHLSGKVASMSPNDREQLYNMLSRWIITPVSTAGFEKAEVMSGGIDTRELSSKTMESRKIKGMYFIGEAVDVTGQLGGYNFQWAWSSGFAAGSFC